MQNKQKSTKINFQNPCTQELGTVSALTLGHYHGDATEIRRPNNYFKRIGEY